MNNKSKQPKSSFQLIPMDQLSIGRSQMRTRDTDAGIDELATSIASVGLLEPIVVFESENGGFEIVTGQRRFLACSSLDWDTMPCMVLEKAPADDFKALTISLTENLMRREPSDRDYIDACTRLFERYGTIKDVVEETGLPAAKVSQYVKAPQLTDSLRRMVDQGQLNMDQALAANDAGNLSDGKDEAFAERVAEVMIHEQMRPQVAKNFAKRVREKAESQGVEAITEEGLSAEAFKKSSSKSLNVKISAQINEGLNKFAQDLGSSRPNAAEVLISDGLQSRGYVPEDGD